MWITKLQLSNVKSYGSESPEITFKQGVNLLRGRNGAGKSTILESIGLALFGTRLYTQAQMIREGEKRGEIIVGFVNTHDDREYELVRSLGAGGQTYIVDPTTNIKIREGVADTNDFVRACLGIEPDSDLESLFADAVGVPQGTMTAIFLEKASLRKAKFDGLLRLESYRKVFDYLNETRRYIDERITENAQRQARLEGELAGFEDATDQVAALEQDIASINEVLEIRRTEREQLQGIVDDLNVKRTDLEAIEDDVNRLIMDFNGAQARVHLAEERVLEAQSAAEQVAALADGYHAYLTAHEALADLDVARHERDRHQASLQAIQTKLLLEEQSHEQVTQELREVQTAINQLDDLAEQAARQTSLESELVAANTLALWTQPVAAQLQRLQANVEEYQSTLGDFGEAVQSEVDAIDVLLADDDRARVELSGVLTQHYDRLREAMQRVEQVNDDLAIARKDEAQLKARATEMQYGVAQRIQVKQTVAELELQRQTVSNQQAQQNEQLGGVVSELRKLGEYESLLNTEDAECPVCKRPMDEHTQESTAAHYASERERWAAEQQAIEQQLTELQTTWDAIGEQLTDLNQQLAELPLVGEFDDIKDQLAQVILQVAALNDACDESLTTVGNQLATTTVVFARVEVQTAEWQTVIERRGSLQQTLAELGDPRHGYEQALSIAGQQAAITEKFDLQQQSIEAYRQEISAIEDLLIPFADLDDQMMQARHDRDVNNDAYQAYLQHIAVADSLAKRDSMLVEQRELLMRIQSDLDRQQSQLDDHAATYDAEMHQQQQQALQALSVEIAREETIQQNTMRQLEQQREHVLRLEAKAEQHAALRKDHERLRGRAEAFRFVRRSIQQAGPQITRQLISVITEDANRMFGDILEDYSMTLNWADDYAISVLHQGQERDFKLLSGGEQMVAAMAVRLALLTRLTNVQFAFFDEPTTNLDDVRRGQLAARLAEIRSLRQLFIISHDDTFEQESYHVIQVEKHDGISHAEVL